MSGYPWAIEDKINAAIAGLAKSHEVSEVRGHVDRLECSIREASAVVDGLRGELEAAKDTIREILEVMQTMLDLHKDSK